MTAPFVITRTVDAPRDKARISVQWVPVDASTDIERRTFDEGRDSMKQGWSGTFEQLESYLSL